MPLPLPLPLPLLLLLLLPIIEINNELRLGLVHGAMQDKWANVCVCFFSCPHEKSAKCKV